MILIAADAGHLNTEQHQSYDHGHDNNNHDHSHKEHDHDHLHCRAHVPDREHGHQRIMNSIVNMIMMVIKGMGMNRMAKVG